MLAGLLDIDARPPSAATVLDTWNPLDKSASIVLSNGNKTATSTAGGPNGVRGVGSHTTGKWYVEIATGIFDGNVFDEDGLGFTIAAQGLTTLPGGASFWTRSADGLMLINGVSTTKSINSLQGSGPGTNTIQFAIDLDAKRIWATSTFNGHGWIGTAGVSDPVTGTNGFDISGVFGPGVAVFICMGGDNTSTDVATLNQVLSFTPPTGFVQW